MRYIKAGLLDDVVSSYDQTKTTVQGRAFSKTVDSKTALGPPLNKFLDAFTDAAVVPAPNAHYMTPNGRVFIFQLEATGLGVIALYTINYDTGATAYVGKVQVAMPDTAATTHVYRSIKAIDTGTTGWKLYFTTTGSVLINGGSFVVNNLALADFVPIGFPTIPFATGNAQKAVYFMQDPANTGAAHVNSNTASAGSVLDIASNRMYVHNGVSATHQYYVFDTSAALTYTTFAITGTEATNLINHAGHTFVNGDPVTFTALTGGAGFTVGTTYFVVSAVAGVSYQLSATSGGAAINFTTDISAGTIGRAFGTSHASFLFKTGNLPVITGTLLLTDSEDFAQPQHGPLSGFDCAFFSTNSNLYLGKLSELTTGAVTWPSLATVNLLGSPNQIIAPAATYATWSNALDRAIYTVGTVFVIKSFVNNVIEKIFGGNNNRYLEGVSTEAIEFQPFTAITGMDVENGWIGVSTGSTGQRGIFLCDLRSDSHFDYSFITTKVLSLNPSVLKFLTTLDALYDYTGSLDIYYRTSGFGSISGGWTSIPFAEDLTAFASGTQIQFKILFSTLALDTSIHAQLCEFVLGYDSLTDNSEHWELSVDDSENGSPSKSAFRLKKAYPSTVPTLYYRALDLTDVTLVTHNTVTNAGLFEYSTNSGVSWLALGTIPNTVGTLVRYTFSSSPGVDIRPSLKEA
ncbi:MAG: hypothetical protein BWY19_00810 [bacterium ADurb.Bin212]|nr:MAG: hypothetical protein BWY19_00810 [bacterium ADurb.Bin212]